MLADSAPLAPVQEAPVSRATRNYFFQLFDREAADQTVNFAAELGAFDLTARQLKTLRKDWSARPGEEAQVPPQIPGYSYVKGTGQLLGWRIMPTKGYSKRSIGAVTLIREEWLVCFVSRSTSMMESFPSLDDACFRCVAVHEEHLQSIENERTASLARFAA